MSNGMRIPILTFQLKIRAMARANKEKMILHKIQQEIMVDLFKLNAKQIVRQMDHIEFAKVINDLPEGELHYIAILMRLQFEFIEIEEYLYCIPIQEFINGE